MLSYTYKHTVHDALSSVGKNPRKYHWEEQQNTAENIAQNVKLL